jgi:hypothetical protein
MPLKRGYKTKATRARKPRQHGGSNFGDRIKAETKKIGDKVRTDTKKAGDWFKNAGSFFKEHKLLSSGLKGIAEYSPGIVKPIAGFAYGVANQLGYGVMLPGAPSQHGHGIVKTMPYKKVLRGTGMASHRVRGSGVLLPGQRAHTVKRQRIIKADVLHEQSGNGRIVGNRLY